MNKTPPDTMVDEIAMLLSTDWFLPYWTVLGIAATDQKQCVQKGCREIVRQIMNEAANYFLVDFSDGRLGVTRQGLRALWKKCGLAESTQTLLGDLVESKPERAQFCKGAWLFRQLIEKLVKDDKLDAAIRHVLERARSKDQPSITLTFNRYARSRAPHGTTTFEA